MVTPKCLQSCHRPPDILVVDGLIFYRNSFFFFFRRLLSELAKRNSTKIGHMLGSITAIWKRMSKICGISSPCKSGVQKPSFWTTSQLNGNFNGLYLPNEIRHRQSVKCVDNYKGFPTSSPNVMNFGLQTASNWTAILPILCKFCFLRHFQASQTRRSANRIQPHFVKRRVVNRANNPL